MVLTEKKLERLTSEFDRIGYVKLASFFSEEVIENLQKEALRLLSKHGKRKDFVMDETDFTLRKITTVSGNLIDEESTMITDMYKDEKLISYLEEICDNKLFLTPDMADRHAIHMLHKKDDVHGGHLDTYPYVLITCLESPGVDGGGELEFVPFSENMDDLGSEKSVFDKLDVGDSYFMTASKSIHRVLPLKKDKNRTVLVFTYADEFSKDIEISYSSNKLYD
ncbi:hypothetical protein EZY14_017755 [Kordia sp. TARA_039_SRF]|jgi:hypothetical protein|nr:hypothetical protein EZY14_017755 [Kordia sp. TARA_039_SRF]